MELLLDWAANEPCESLSPHPKPCALENYSTSPSSSYKAAPQRDTYACNTPKDWPLTVAKTLQFYYYRSAAPPLPHSLPAPTTEPDLF